MRKPREKNKEKVLNALIPGVYLSVATVSKITGLAGNTVRNVLKLSDKVVERKDGKKRVFYTQIGTSEDDERIEISESDINKVIDKMSSGVRITIARLVNLTKLPRNKVAKILNHLSCLRLVEVYQTPNLTKYSLKTDVIEKNFQEVSEELRWKFNNLEVEYDMLKRKNSKLKNWLNKKVSVNITLQKLVVALTAVLVVLILIYPIGGGI